MNKNYLPLLFLFISLVSFAEYVERPNIGTISECEYKFESSQKLIGTAECRFLYSPKWGWIDLRHFGSAAKLINNKSWQYRSIFILDFAILAGESLEQTYELEKPNSPSTYSYEDLISNFLGASFQLLYNRGYFKDTSRPNSIKYFLDKVGISENPMQNFEKFSQGECLEDYNNVKNRTYRPIMNIEDSTIASNDIQRKLIKFRKRAEWLVSPNTNAREKTFKFLKKRAPRLYAKIVNSGFGNL